MAVRTITYFGTLMQYASAMGKAEQSGDAEAYRVAKAKHDEYAALCLLADEMIIGRVGDV